MGDMTPEEKLKRHRIACQKYRDKNRLKTNEWNKNYNRKQREINIEYIRERYRNWYKRTIKERKLHEKTPENREIMRKASLKWKQNNIKKYLAVRKVFNAVRRGDIIKTPCFCGEKKVQSHHEDYSKPLEVRWLCKKHHMEADILRRQNEI